MNVAKNLLTKNSQTAHPFFLEYVLHQLKKCLFLIRLIDFWCLLPLSAIFQLYHGDQFKWWKKPEYPERTTNHGQATGKLYHLRLRVKCTPLCNLQRRAWTHVVLVIGLYEWLGNPTIYLIEPPGSFFNSI